MSIIVESLEIIKTQSPNLYNLFLNDYPNMETDGKTAMEVVADFWCKRLDEYQATTNKETLHQQLFLREAAEINTSIFIEYVHNTVSPNLIKDEAALLEEWSLVTH